MAQLLIELFSEEIPARMQLGAARDFERLFGGKLTVAGLSYEALKAYVGPRRLTLVVEGLPTETAAVTEEVKGPKESAPPQAMEGFLRKVGLSQDKLVLENGVWMARIEKPGVKTVDVLGDMLREVILSFPWPKSMRSGTSTFRWVRPLKRILFLFDGEVIPFALEGLTAGNLTEGHRFLGSGQALTVNDFASYQKALADNSVILDHTERQKIILEQAKAVCAEAGCELIEDQGLLEEVAGLNEFPVPLLGDMDPAFLTLPPEVIKTSMRTHQKYFAVRDKTGKMAAKFVITSNMKAVDGGAEIKRGNAKVLSARLSDGVFFWKEDNREGNFDQWLTKLEGVTFHAKLGTMAQRVWRLEALARDIAPFVHADPVVAAEAARLAKADLASYMVGEFPELQGVMGGYYADAAGLKPEIAHAIRQHYKPQGPTDSPPEGKVAATVALADKIDTLVGFFAIGEKPTGSKDPYALRRSALGIIRLLVATNSRLNLLNIFPLAVRRSISTGDSDWLSKRGYELDMAGVEASDFPKLLVELKKFGETSAWAAVIEKKFELTKLFNEVNSPGFVLNYSNPTLSNVVKSISKFYYDVARLIKGVEDVVDSSDLQDVRDELESVQIWADIGFQHIPFDLLIFFIDRLKVLLREEGKALDVIEAVLAVEDDDIVRLIKKIEAIETVKASPFGNDLIAVHKRAANILAAEAKKGELPTGKPKGLPDAPAVESALLTQLNTVRRGIGTALDQEKYIDALHHIAALRQGVDAFLDGVLVNADDASVRANRLLILKAVCELSGEIADLSKIA